MTKTRKVTSARRPKGQSAGKSFNFRASTSQRAALEGWAEELGVSMTSVFSLILDKEMAQLRLIPAAISGRVSIEKSEIVRLGNIVMELGFVLEEIQIRSSKRRRGKAKELFADALCAIRSLREDILCI